MENLSFKNVLVCNEKVEDRSKWFAVGCKYGCEKKCIDFIKDNLEIKKVNGVSLLNDVKKIYYMSKSGNILIKMNYSNDIWECIHTSNYTNQSYYNNPQHSKDSQVESYLKNCICAYDSSTL